MTDTSLPFSTPAFIQDLQGAAQDQLNQEWNRNVHAFTQQAIGGNPWNTGYLNAQAQFVPSPAQDLYFDTASTTIPAGTASVCVQWDAFPNRITTYCGANQSPPNPYSLNQQQLWELGDTGYYTDKRGKHPLPNIPVTLCPNPQWQGTLQPYGPYGPRGWQDEYCEWSVTRNSDNQITRVDFVCENPEYWYTLWRVAPQAVADLYQSTLNAGLPEDSSSRISVELSDLYLHDPVTGEVVNDPYTGLPAYNPLNKWNSGPHAARGGMASGGAMHLTSTPNTLQTEMGLAGAATVQRTVGNVSAQKLICCSQYGQANRNSDPHIGQSVNQVVGGPPSAMAALANPAGLYIQMPDFSNYALPADPNLPPGAKVEDCWHILRGSESLIDPVTGSAFPGNFILHAAFQIPAAWIEAGVKFTVSDITISSYGVAYPIIWAAQITETFNVGLFARGLPHDPNPVQTCVVNLDNPATAPLPAAQVQPVQLMYLSLWKALYNTPVQNVVDAPMNLASNSVIVPLPCKQGQTGLQAALICSTAIKLNGQLPSVSVANADIQIQVSTAADLVDVTYAAPGNSYPSRFQMLTLSIDIGSAVEPGLYPLQVSNPGTGMPPDVPAAAMLNVFAA